MMRTTEMVTISGLKIYVVSDPIYKLTSLSLRVGVGSAVEQQGEEGLAHFLEHLAFRSSKNYKEGEIEATMVGYGAHPNAYTCGSKTVYGMTILPEYIRNAPRMLYDMVFNTVITDIGVQKEKPIVIAELDQRGGDDKAYEISNPYIDTKEYKRPVIGFKETIRSFNAYKVMDFHDKWYTHTNANMSITTNLSIQDVKDALIRMDINRSRVRGKVAVMPEMKYNINDVYFPSRKPELLITYCLPANVFNRDKDTAKMQIVRYILSGSLSSRLYKRIREELGLCYQLGAYFRHNPDGSLIWNIYVSYNDKNKTQVIIDEIDRIINTLSGTITAKEFNGARNQYLAGLISNIANGEEHSDTLTERMAHTMILDDEKRMEMIKFITLQEINNRQFLSSIFDDAKKCTLYFGGTPSKKVNGASQQEAAIIDEYGVAGVIDNDKFN